MASLPFGQSTKGQWRIDSAATGETGWGRAVSDKDALASVSLAANSKPAAPLPTITVSGSPVSPGGLRKNVSVTRGYQRLRIQLLAHSTHRMLLLEVKSPYGLRVGPAVLERCQMAFQWEPAYCS